MSADGKHFENEYNHVNFCCTSLPLNRKYDRSLSRYLGVVHVDGKYLMRFRSETSVFKFLRRNVDEAKTHFVRCTKCQEIAYILPRLLYEKGKKHVIKSHNAWRPLRELDTFRGADVEISIYS